MSEGKDRVCQIIGGSGMNFINGKWYFAAECDEEDPTESMTKHERDVRKALKAFEPMLPNTVMEKMRTVI